MDLLIGKHDHDILDDEIWTKTLEEIALGRYDVQLVTPPCNTHSRAVFANTGGPAPLRSRQYPF
eukprot:9219769-Karenia_brevis.AAC.1